MIYGTGFNGVEGSATALKLSPGQTALKLNGDTIRLAIPASIPASVSVDLGPGGELHFVSANDREVNLSATFAGQPAQSVEIRGRHVILQNVGSQLRSIK
jgi:hypothetical protein